MLRTWNFGNPIQAKTKFLVALDLHVIVFIRFLFSPPNRSPDRDSIKKPPFQDDVDDDDSLADYTEGYGDMGQYGTDKKDTNGTTVCWPNY